MSHRAALAGNPPKKKSATRGFPRRYSVGQAGTIRTSDVVAVTVCDIDASAVPSQCVANRESRLRAWLIRVTWLWWETGPLPAAEGREEVGHAVQQQQLQ